MNKEISPQEQKKIALDILIKFSQYCDEHGIYYTLAGGTLLGAIRHKGFIPWDDDIDINMPREDFEKLRKLLKQEKISKNISFKDIDTKENMYPYIKLVDNRTIQESKDSKNQTGIWIDVFPVDKVLENEEAQKKQFKNARFWRAGIISLNVNIKESKGIIKNTAKITFKLLGKILGEKKFIDNSQKNAKKFNSSKSDLMAGVLWGYGPGEILTSEEYLNYELVEFENNKFKAPVGWKKYLTGLYGDYMELPPKDKQVAHNVKVYWKN